MAARRARAVKGLMLQALLLAGLVAAPLGSLALFVPIRRHARRAGAWSAIRRFILDVIGTVVLAAAVAVALRLLGASQHNLLAGAAGVIFASLIWLPVTWGWSARAHLCWASTVFLFVVFLIYALEWTLDSHLRHASFVALREDADARCKEKSIKVTFVSSPRFLDGARTPRQHGEMIELGNVL